MATKTVSASQIEVDDDYNRFEQIIRDRVADVTGPVFDTDALPDELWREWLEAIPSDKRTHYNCRACNTFIGKYGRLVTIDTRGALNPVLWDQHNNPAFFDTGVLKLWSMVERSKVTGPFLWGPKEAVWGTPVTGSWTHLSGTPGRPAFTHALKTAGQEMAERKQDFGILSRSLAEYGLDVLAQAVRVLEADALYRSEKALGGARWAEELHRKLEGAKGSRRSNLIWLAVATAPPGFCHLRTTVISTLLDDIKAGLPFDRISRKWAEKMHPLQYQRPTAPPKAGAIAEAEKVFEKMGAGRALERRVAKLEDVACWLWKPTPPEKLPAFPSGRLFDHLRTDRQPVKELELPAKPITFEKFRKEVLPTALEMEVLVPAHGNFYGLTTAIHADAPPILQWDGLDGWPRNPVSGYVYSSGSLATNWHLTGGSWAGVTVVFLAPNKWQCPEKFDHHSKSVHFALVGAVDKQGKTSGLAIFPETLRSEFHSVRSVVEAHSRKGQLVGVEEGTANGLLYSDRAMWTVRVTTAGGRASYRIDRWD